MDQHESQRLHLHSAHGPRESPAEQQGRDGAGSRPSSSLRRRVGQFDERASPAVEEELFAGATRRPAVALDVGLAASHVGRSLLC